MIIVPVQEVGVRAHLTTVILSRDGQVGLHSADLPRTRYRLEMHVLPARLVLPVDIRVVSGKGGKSCHVKHNLENVSRIRRESRM
jgi:hypothetical protein